MTASTLHCTATHSRVVVRSARFRPIVGISSWILLRANDATSVRRMGMATVVAGSGAKWDRAVVTAY